MRKLLYFILIFLLFSCGNIRQIPINTVTNYRDSVIVNVIDSTVYIPKEIVKDIVPQYDTLQLETTVAKAIAYVDTTNHILRGSIKNKKDIQYKYIYKDRIEYRDSISIKEIPVEVEKIVHKHYWYEKYLIVFSIICLLGICIKLFHK